MVRNGHLLQVFRQVNLHYRGFLCHSQVQCKYSVNLVFSLTFSPTLFQLQDMSDGQDYILDCEYDPRGDRLLDLLADLEEEPMDEDNCIILEKEEDLLSVPA